MKSSRRFPPLILTAFWISTGLAPAAGSGTVRVPIRWCALQGTKAVVNPACAGDSSTKDVLWRRHERTTETHYLPFCNVSLRSAALFAQPSFPIIADPCNGSVTPACKGVQGDIVLSAFEHIQMMQNCAAAWNALGVGDIGIVAVNIRRFIDAQGNEIGTLGATTDYGSVAGQEIAVIDNDFTLAVPNQPPGCVSPEPFVPDPHEQIFGHEFGHANSLPHTIVQNGDPSTLMNPLYPLVDFLTSGGAGQTDTVCPNPIPDPNTLTQCGRARIYGLCNTNGIEVDPPPVVDSMPLDAGDVSPEYVDLRKVGLISDSNFDKGTFFWHVGLFPRLANGIEFTFAIDLDRDPNTGGDPGTLGLPLTLAGVELAGRVEVNVDQQPDQPKAFTTAERLWSFSSGSFALTPALGSKAVEVMMQILQASPPTLPPEMPWGSFIGIEFDRRLLEVAPGITATTVRFQASATDSQSLGLVPSRDQPPPGDLFLITPALSVCQMSPAEALPGALVSVTASGLSINQSTHVLVGPDVVTTGTTNDEGRTTSQFVVPQGIAAGRHLITIGVDDPNDAITADCELTVLASPSGAGTVPDDLMVTLDPSGQIRLRWDPSCASGDGDYEIYEGSLPIFYSHASRLCSTGGATSTLLVPGSGNNYYLVVPGNGAREGSYGLTSDGRPRPPGASQCRPQETPVCP
ncbi:MAG TPA: hypothetical protein VGK94_15495 [Candidatus Polarisedimenticolia bacterium]